MSAKYTDGGRAFPTDAENGMWLRDYFAAKAMQALIASGDGEKASVLAEQSYNMADHMIKARTP